MMKRTFFLVLLVSITPVLFSFIGGNKNKQKILRTIIVDAGHGIMPSGGHNGAKGSYSYEDDICLVIAKELVSQLREALPEVKIIETRPTQDIVALHRRAEIANENK